MKFIDLSTKDKLTADRIKIAVSVISIILLCALATIGVVNIMEAQSRADRQARASELESMLAATEKQEDESETLVSEEANSSTEATQDGEPPFRESDDSDGSTSVSDGTDESDETSSSDSEASSVTSEAPETEAADTSAATEAPVETTAETTAGITEAEFYAEVYAASELNLREGPGTEYDIVRTLSAGDKIDVIASTSNGWYKTYNGNYVIQSLTTTTPPETVATTTTVAATQATTQATTASTTQSTTQATAAPTSSNAESIDGMTYYGSCHITFYGPQPTGDGGYNTSTATGTTCSEGRTVAADWSIFPAGTTIYIANDPLGGDGYYTVEDRGSGVTGSHIDIYADDGESYSSTSCDVYIVN